ncbi:MAG: TIGR03915 family putative DNA repair protein [Prevotella sp.]|nr:TIGR03915 family putative DNA repair protein [Prevotella sp.]
MQVYVFDNTLDGLLTAVFDSFFLRQQPEMLLAEGEQLPLFADEPHVVVTDSEKAARVWKGLEKHLSVEGLRMIAISWLSEERTLNQPLFNFICKVFKPHPLTPSPRGEGEAFGREGMIMDITQNASDADVLAVRNTCRRVLHEQLRMKQFIRFQKAKDGTYLAVVSPDHNVLSLITHHFQDRFNDQPWLIYDAKRHYGYYYDGSASPIHITFEDESAVPFDLTNGKLDDDVLSENDKIFQDLWRTYFKAICIKERMNPKKQLNDMPRRYWKYMTEKN